MACAKVAKNVCSHHRKPAGRRVESVALCTYIIAFRADSTGTRAANLAAVINHVRGLDNVEVIVVEQAATSTFTPPPGVGHVFLAHGGAFNKAWAMNVGFRQASTNILAFGDADLIVPLVSIERAIGEVTDRFEAVKPFDRIVDLNDTDTQLVVTGYPLPPPAGDIVRLRREGEYLPFCGGLFLINGEEFARVGGYDERFTGWGGEDDGLSIKLSRAQVRRGMSQGAVAYHLWHARTSARYTHADYGRNVARLEWLTECSPAEFESLCAHDAKRMGYQRGPIDV
jgi:glycosyltransferase involved in cell wall biosynthesis